MEKPVMKAVLNLREVANLNDRGGMEETTWFSAENNMQKNSFFFYRFYGSRQSLSMNSER